MTKQVPIARPTGEISFRRYCNPFDTLVYNKSVGCSIAVTDSVTLGQRPTTAQTQPAWLSSHTNSAQACPATAFRFWSLRNDPARYKSLQIRIASSVAAWILRLVHASPIR